MEQLRSVKITVEIDTNKQTYTQEFESMEGVQEYYDEIMGGFE